MQDAFNVQFQAMQAEFDKQQANARDELDNANKLLQEVSLKLQMTNAESCKEHDIKSENLAQAEKERDHFKSLC
jgi:hypothetical protein